MRKCVELLNEELIIEIIIRYCYCLERLDEVSSRIVKKSTENDTYSTEERIFSVLSHMVIREEDIGQVWPIRSTVPSPNTINSRFVSFISNAKDK